MKPISQFQKLFISIIFYIAVFYKQDVGINISLTSLLLWTLSSLNLPKEKRTNVYWLLSSAVFVSAIAYAWYGDALSFISLFLSTFIIAIFTQNNELKIISYPILAAYSFVSFIVRIFFVRKWIPKGKIDNKLGKKAIAYFLIPIILVTLFICIYTMGSDMFDSFFKNLHFNFDMGMIVFLSTSGFYFMFNYWYMMPPEMLLTLNDKLHNNLSPDTIRPKPTFDFLEMDFERKSGEISLLLLNILLLIFIITYNYEQFTGITKNINLSGEIHQRINSIIVSIVMAISVILFYFKSSFNFDKKAKQLKHLAVCWIIFNCVLIISAISKNTEYIYHLGLTFKRIGVYIFLLLSIIGLISTYFKIKNKQSNYFLISKMFIVFFITIVLNCIINWSWIVTKYNLAYVKNTDHNYHYLQSLDFNKQTLYDQFKSNPDWASYFEDEKANIENKKEKSFLSKSFYFQTINLH